MPKPQLDVVTRWSSTYNMLKRLLGLKEFCTNNLSASENLKNSEWATIENLVTVLEPVHELTLKLQRSQLILGDFYKFWMELIFKLRNINTEDANKLLGNIESRQSSLLENETMYAALFVDPRFRRLLSFTKKEAAKKHLKKLFQQMQCIETESTTTQINNNTAEKVFVDESSMQSSSSSLLRSAFREMEILNSSSDDDDISYEFSENTRKAFYEIDNYKEKRLDVDDDLVEYWRNKKFVLPNLRKLALILHSVPATQVSVERSFSALKLILGDLRYNLSEENLEAIMIAKLNSKNFLT